MKAKQYINLEARIIADGKSNATLAAEMGIAATTLHNKRTGKTEFTAKDIRRLKEILNLSQEELNGIFFN